MPLLKAQKHELAQEYLALLNSAVNVVVLQYSQLSVNDVNTLRQDLAEVGGVLKIVKKRVFLKGIEGESGLYDGLDLSQVPGSVALLLATSEDAKFAPLKALSKLSSSWKKAKKATDISYVGARFDGERKDSEYVAEIANLPSREELIGKFLFMLNHPVSSFARVVKAIADKGE